MKAEYLHADFGLGLFINPPVIVVQSNSVVSRNVSLTEDFFPAGVNWKFHSTRPSFQRR